MADQGHITRPLIALILLVVLQASCSSPGEEGDDADAQDTEAGDDGRVDIDAVDADAQEDAVGEDASDTAEDAEEEEGNPHTQMLGALGIDTSPPDPTDPDGNPLPEGFNPFGRRHTVFNPIKEVYFAGFGHSGKNQYLIDDANALYGDLYATADDSWTSSPYKNVIGADVDGDGFDEVFIVFYVPADMALYFKVVDLEFDEYVEYDGVVAEDVSTLPSNPSLSSAWQPGLAKGDLDGDGMDEVAVAFAGMYLVDDMDTSFVVTSREYPGLVDLYVAAGELDGDGRDELIVTYHFGGYAYCDIFDGGLASPLFRETLILHAPYLSHTYERDAHVQVGDVDGDNLDEIIFLGKQRDTFDN